MRTQRLTVLEHLQLALWDEHCKADSLAPLRRQESRLARLLWSTRGLTTTHCERRVCAFSPKAAEKGALFTKSADRCTKTSSHRPSAWQNGYCRMQDMSMKIQASGFSPRYTLNVAAPANSFPHPVPFLSCASYVSERS